MTFLKIALAVAIVSVVTAAAAIHHENERAENQLSQTYQWDTPVAAPFGATGFVDLDIIY